MSYRVDTVPWFLKPLFWLYGYGGGVLLFFALGFLRLTCRIEYQGERFPNGRKNNIYCAWHDQTMPCLVIMIGHWKGISVINHPAWYMGHIHVFLFLSGLRRIHLGSIGFGGREAANRVVKDIRSGYGTWLNPDGPYGPLHQLKKGALHMAVQSGVPIVPMQIISHSHYKIRSSWDGKQVPYPFSKITVRFLDPIYVTEENFEKAQEEVAKALDS